MAKGDKVKGVYYMTRSDGETDIPAESDIDPQPETDLTVADTLAMLNELGVETDDQ